VASGGIFQIVCTVSQDRKAGTVEKTPQSMVGMERKPLDRRSLLEGAAMPKMVQEIKEASAEAMGKLAKPAKTLGYSGNAKEIYGS